MPIWKLQTQIWSDSTLPRDSFVITPHFNDQGVGSDPQQLCEDLAAVIDTWVGLPHQITVKAYDAQGTVPVFPAGEATINTGASSASATPREVALCLSFYGGRNLPRQRGRLYLPAPYLGPTAARPTLAQMNKVGTLAAGFADLGGVDVDWCVFSRTTDTAHAITNWWVDDEWDTVRSRGLRTVTRVTGVTTEA